MYIFSASVCDSGYLRHRVGMVLKKLQVTTGNNCGCSVVANKKTCVERLFYLIGNHIQVYYIPIK